MGKDFIKQHVFNKYFHMVIGGFQGSRWWSISEMLRLIGDRKLNYIPQFYLLGHLYSRRRAFARNVEILLICFRQCIVRSAVLCLRGSRTIKQEVNYDINNIEILNEIGRIVQTFIDNNVQFNQYFRSCFYGQINKKCSIQQNY